MMHTEGSQPAGFAYLDDQIDSRQAAAERSLNDGQGESEPTREAGLHPHDMCPVTSELTPLRHPVPQ